MAWTKKRIIASFTKASNLKILILTDAFCMGINCYNIQPIIHYGVPSDPETYTKLGEVAGMEKFLCYYVTCKTSDAKL